MMTLLNIARLQNFIDYYNINLLNFIFVVFTLLIVFCGSLMTLMETRLPTSIRQSFRYGKHSHKGTTDPLISLLEVPKSWFKHFYLFALTWALLALYLTIMVIYEQNTAPEYVLDFLDFMAGGAANRRVLLDSNTTLFGTVLLTLQCLRRFYETHFVQIFSKTSKMNLSHYMVGYIHYFGAFVALLANSAGFVRGTKALPLSLHGIMGLRIIYIVGFLFAWYLQYETNIILANLRKDAKTGAVRTEQHLLPKGGSFEYISSPHMLYEVLMYCCLTLLLHKSSSWLYICFWVVSNQVTNALLTHQWYQQNFKQYPKNRYAIIPFLL